MKVKDIDGLPVINAKKSITLKVTARDISGADSKEPADCAFARACRRELHAKEARVHLGRVYLRHNAGNWVRYLTPKTLRSEIIAFDRGGGIRARRVHLAAAATEQANREAPGLRQDRAPALRQRQEAPAAARRHQRPHRAGVAATADYASAG